MFTFDKKLPTIKERIIKTDAIINLLMGKKNELRNVSKKCTKLSKKFEEKSNEVVLVKTECSNIQNNLIANVAERMKLETERNNLINQNYHLQTNVSGLEIHVKDLLQETTSMKGEISAMRKVADTLRKALETYQNYPIVSKTSIETQTTTLPIYRIAKRNLHNGKSTDKPRVFNKTRQRRQTIIYSQKKRFKYKPNATQRGERICSQSIKHRLQSLRNTLKVCNCIEEKLQGHENNQDDSCRKSKQPIMSKGNRYTLVIDMLIKLIGKKIETVNNFLSENKPNSIDIKIEAISNPSSVKPDYKDSCLVSEDEVKEELENRSHPLVDDIFSEMLPVPTLLSPFADDLEEGASDQKKSYDVASGNNNVLPQLKDSSVQTPKRFLHQNESKMAILKTVDTQTLSQCTHRSLQTEKMKFSNQTTQTDQLKVESLSSTITSGEISALKVSGDRKKWNTSFRSSSGSFSVQDTIGHSSAPTIFRTQNKRERLNPTTAQLDLKQSIERLFKSSPLLKRGDQLFGFTQKIYRNMSKYLSLMKHRCTKLFQSEQFKINVWMKINNRTKKRQRMNRKRQLKIEQPLVDVKYEMDVCGNLLKHLSIHCLSGNALFCDNLPKFTLQTVHCKCTASTAKDTLNNLNNQILNDRCGYLHHCNKIRNHLKNPKILQPRNIKSRPMDTPKEIQKSSLKNINLNCDSSTDTSSDDNIPLSYFKSKCNKNRNSSVKKRKLFELFESDKNDSQDEVTEKSKKRKIPTELSVKAPQSLPIIQKIRTRLQTRNKTAEQIVTRTIPVNKQNRLSSKKSKSNYDKTDMKSPGRSDNLDIKSQLNINGDVSPKDWDTPFNTSEHFLSIENMNMRTKYAQILRKTPVKPVKVAGFKKALCSTRGKINTVNNARRSARITSKSKSNVSSYENRGLLDEILKPAARLLSVEKASKSIENANTHDKSILTSSTSLLTVKDTPNSINDSNIYIRNANDSLANEGNSVNENNKTNRLLPGILKTNNNLNSEKMINKRKNLIEKSNLYTESINLNLTKENEILNRISNENNGVGKEDGEEGSFHKKPTKTPALRCLNVVPQNLNSLIVSASTIRLNYENQINQNVPTPEDDVQLSEEDNNEIHQSTPQSPIIPVELNQINEFDFPIINFSFYNATRPEKPDQTSNEASATVSDTPPTIDCESNDKYRIQSADIVTGNRVERPTTTRHQIEQNFMSAESWSRYRQVGRMKAQNQKWGKKRHWALEKRAELEIDRFMEGEFTKDSVETAVTELRNCDVSNIISLIHQEIINDNTSQLSEKQTPPAPPLTALQQRLITLIVHLQDAFLPNDFACLLLNYIESKILYVPCNMWQLEKQTRVFVALCRLRWDMERARLLCCEALYYLDQKALPITFTVLSCWPEVLPIKGTLTAENYLLETLVFTLVRKSCIMVGYQKKALRALIKNYYQYDDLDTTASDFAGKLMVAFKSDVTTTLEYAILVFCRNQTSTFTHKFIIKPYLFEYIDAYVDLATQQQQRTEALTDSESLAGRSLELLLRITPSCRHPKDAIIINDIIFRQQRIQESKDILNELIVFKSQLIIDRFCSPSKPTNGAAVPNTG